MRVKKTLAILAAVAVLGGACKKKDPVLPPVRTTPTPVVVPPNPTPAPTRPTSGTELPPVDEITRVQGMSIDEIDRMGFFTDIFFDYDQAELREADRAALARNAENLKKFYFLTISIEGHADERGTVEYNLALSDKRARVVYDYLVSVGISPSRLKAVAYGKEIPVCTESNEDCWQRNRRAHSVVTGKNAQ